MLSAACIERPKLSVYTVTRKTTIVSIKKRPTLTMVWTVDRIA